MINQHTFRLILRAKISQRHNDHHFFMTKTLFTLQSLKFRAFFRLSYKNMCILCSQHRQCWIFAVNSAWITIDQSVVLIVNFNQKKRRSYDMMMMSSFNENENIECFKMNNSRNNSCGWVKFSELNSLRPGTCDLLLGQIVHLSEVSC